MGSVAKSYMRKGFLIYEEMRKKYLTLYEEAVGHILLCTRSLLNFLIYEENFIFLFISVTKKTTVKKSRFISCTVSLQGLQLQVRADQSGDLCARTLDPLQPVSSAYPPFTLSTDLNPKTAH
jgi:hypothetical protein